MRYSLPALLLVVACGGAPHPTAVPGHHGEPIGVTAAGLPFAIVDGHTGRAVSTEAFWAALAGAQAVCVGEEHPNPHHHWAQLQVVEHLAGESVIESIARADRALYQAKQQGRNKVVAG